MDEFEVSLSNSPPFQRQRLQNAGIRSLENLKQFLPLCHSLKDKTAQVAYAKQLKLFLARKYPLTDEDRVFFVRIVLDLILNCFDLQLQARWMGALKNLLEKKPLDIVIDWRPLYELLMKCHLYRDNNLGGFPTGECDPLFGAISSTHRSNIITLLCKTRKYFSENATKEILDTLLPGLTPFDNIYFRSQQLLCILLPDKYPQQCQEWLPKMVDEMEKVDRSQSTTLGYLVLFARVAKHSIGVIDWSPYLPRIFAHFVQILNLKAEIPNPNRKSRRLGSNYSFILKRYGSPMTSIAKYMGKLIAYTLGPNTPTSDLTVNLMQSISTFYYPSNTGSWASYLGIFLTSMAAYVARRHGKQARKEIPQPEGFAFDVGDKGLLECLLPIACQALFHKSQAMVTCGHRALRLLGLVYPEDVYPKILELSYPALADVTKSHRTQGCLKALSSITPTLFNRRRFPGGAAHLQQILWAILPGIDPNDAMKTMHTFQVYSHIFYHIPLIDALDMKSDHSSDSSPGPDGDVDMTEEDARRATMSFMEWGLAYVGAMCNLLEHQDSFEKSNLMDMAKAQIFSRSMHYFWNSLSPNIYDECAKKCVEFILSNQNATAKKYYGLIITAAAFANPKKWLELVTKPLFKKILEEKDGEKCLSHANSALGWNLYLLAISVKKSGPEVLPYLDDLQLIISLCCSVDDKTAKKNGMKIAKNLLNSLCTTYVAEARCFPETYWDKSSSTWKHWQEWGLYVESRREEENLSHVEDLDLHIRWHEPSEEEYKAAQHVVETTLAEPLKLLTRVAAPDADEQVQMDDVVNAIQIVHGVVRGSHAIIGDFEGPDLNASKDARLREREVVCPINTPYVFEPLYVIRHGHESTSLRTSLARLVHQVYKKYLASSNKVDDNSPEKQNSTTNPNIKILTKLTKLSEFLLSQYEVNSKSMETSSMTNHVVIKMQKDLITDEACDVRPLLVERAQAIHAKRIDVNQPLTQEALDLLEDVAHVMVHEYPELALKGASVMSEALKCFRRHKKRVIQFALKVLQDRQTNEKKVVGAINYLLLSDSMSKIVWDWQLLRDSISALYACERHDDHDVQVLTNSLFVAMYSAMFRMHLQIPKTDSDNRNEWIAEQNSRALHTYEQTVGMLVKVLQQGNGDNASESMHWRYVMMAQAFLFKLLRKDHVPSKDFVLEFARGLLDDLLPARNISIRTLDCIAGTFIGATKKPSEDVEIKTWNGAKVLPQDIYHHQFGESLDQDCKDSFERFLLQNCSQIVHALVTNHPALTQQGPKKRKQEGAGQMIAKLVRVGSCWPYSRFSGHSKGFTHYHARFIRNIVNLFPSLVKPLTEELVALTSKDRERDAQCTAAEIFSGVVRASVDWPEDLQREALVDLRSKSIKAMFGCQTESVVDWEDSIRYCLTNQTKEKMRWLVDPLFDASVDDAVDSPSAQAKKLRLFAPILIDIGWKEKSICLQFLKRVSLETSNYLNSPYKQVRQEISRMLFYVIRACQTFSPDKRYRSMEMTPELKPFVSEILQRIEKSQLADASERKEDDDGKHLAETLMYWIMSTIVNGDLVMFSDVVIKSIPHIMRAQNHSDEHFLECAKTVLNIVSWIQFHQSDLEEVVAAVSETSKSESWHVREAVVLFLCVFIPRHALVLSIDLMKVVTKLVTSLLSDPQLEVRLLASKALVSVLLSTNPQKYRPKMTKKFMRLAKTKIIRKRKSISTLSTEAQEKATQALLSRHAGVLGLSAMVTSNPYTVPEGLPAVLSFLTDHVNDPLPIGTSLKKLFTEFKHTHQDSWHEFREKFSEDELSRITDVTGTHSYFA